ncbi:MAG: hypothetical protein F4Y24_10405 [Gemmatimonadetes bacterium]|nr:hypothetical protein [Gemmatimonadota bacterium]MYG22331.1 hypothetical protein [Gemmatimonadota bacterium]MYJ38657.1 hypothetical protein [Gemmatimonadota bacterium]
MFAGLFFQEELGVGTPVWESIPTSIQTIVGVAAVMGAGWTWFVRPRVGAMLSEAVAQVNKERDRTLAEMRDKLRDELRGEIAGNRGEIARNRSAIAANRDSIFALRDLVSAVRIETRDLLSGMQRESRRAHASIGDRIAQESTALRTKMEEEIGALRTRMEEDSRTLRTKMEELGTDTARLAGAVDVLTSIWREGDVRGELRTQ